MTQDMNHTIVKVFRAVFVATMMLTSGNAMADGVVVKGNVYGGGNAADVGTNATVNISGGQIGDNQIDGDHGNVFGGGKGPTTTVVGKVEVNIGKKVVVENNVATVTYSDNGTVKGSVYGGSAFGAVNGTKGTDWDEDNLDKISLTSDGMTTAVNIYAGTVNGNVYGGGRGEKTSSSDIAAKSFGAVTVIIGDANVNKNITVDGNVYGGSDVNGVLESNVQVDVVRGTIGKSTTENEITTITGGNVYGGGLGQPTLVHGTVAVNIHGGTIMKDVYGGGALGNTNIGNVANYGESNESITTTSTNTTIVSLIGGTIDGDVYGGGLGKYTSASDNVPAKVYGDVTVKLNGTADNCVVKGSIFGCNNVYGSPQGAVEVHVYGTKGITEKPTRMTRAEYLALTGEEEPHIYDLEAVYGGGNKAAYEPVNAMLTGTDDATKDLIAAAHTRVIIEGCERSSIRQVYGGGNAASTPGTEVTIKGAYEIEEVFGGGNGKPSAAVPNNNGANVGFQADIDEEGTPGASYGSGKAQVNINGGTIHAVYGGSNTKGNVRIAAVAMLDETSEENCFLVDEAYGGGKSAPMDGRAELQLGCIPGVGNVYGGARAANVNNDVILTITNGDFDNVYGGNNESGTINGSITLNIEETGCRPVNITNLYGGGNLAAYPGPNANSNFTKEITINARSFTTIGNLFGGGYGSTAVVTGDTYVKINQVFGTTYSIQNNQQYTTATTLGTVGNVYGGGSEADVEGNTHVLIGTVETVTFETGPNKNTPQDVLGANITGSVYGGGLSANVSGDTEVKIGTVDLTSTNKQGFIIAQDIYGGGEGSTTNVGGDVVVEVGAVNEDEGTSSTKPYLGGATISGSVYGGSAFGSVNTPSTTSGDTTTPTSGTVTVNLHKGAITGAVYGGGKGQNASGSGETAIPEYTAHVYGKSTVTLNAATVGTGIYGGCNERGRMHGDTEVNLQAGSVGESSAPAEIYGGGLGASTFVDGKATVNAGIITSAGTPTGTTVLSGAIYGGSALGTVADTEVNLNKLSGESFSHNVFGGGKGDDNTAAQVTGTATVNLNEGFVLAGNIYGGCNIYGETANAVVNLIGGTVGTESSNSNVFGGGKGPKTTFASGEGKGTIIVNMGTKSDASTPVYGGSTLVYGDIYGGSENGSVQDVDVNLYGGTVQGNVYGGGYDTADGKTAANDVTVELYGTVFNIRTGSFTTDDNESITCPTTGRIFGCNNLKGSPVGHALVHVYRTASRTGQADSEYDLAAVFGGGNQADYKPTDSKKSTEVIIEGCEYTSIEKVYGGGNAAAVPATEVWILGTKKIDTVFGGGNGELGPSHAANVGIDSQGNRYSSNTGGSGKAETKLVAGNVTTVYGGSNSNGDVTGGSWISMPQKTEYSGYSSTTSCCDNLLADNIYGGGKNANMSGGTNIILGCQPDHQIDEIYAGSQHADISGDVSLTITSGKFARVFGGNRDGGRLMGSITVNIEETGGCDIPIIIGELYGGGNLAPYSIYGYKNTGTESDPVWAPRESATDDGTGPSTPYDNPRLNVRSFTSIGKIFGGGYKALMVADPTVDINVVKGSHYNDAGHDVSGSSYYSGGTMTVNVPATATTAAETLSLDYPAHEKGKIGAIENVFGGGNLATVIGSATVNIGTEPTVMFVTEPNHLGTKGTGEQTLETSGVAYIQRTDGLYEAKSEGANITGNVYGGGNLADVTGSTEVNICAKEVISGTTTSWQSVSPGTAGVTIAGNVYGGGKGVARESGDRAFFCEEAMVGIDGTNSATNNNSSTYANYGTHVRIGNGTIGNGTTGGNVYGGGEIGRVEFHTEVVIGLGEGTGAATKSPVINGSVFGAGKGTNTHGYSGLVRGDSRVTIQGDAKVGHSVYGGGEMASVGKYEVVNGLPKTPLFGGKCTVTIGGYAEIGPDGMLMTQTGGPDDTGHVFGAGKGTLPYENVTGTPWSMQTGGKVNYDEGKESDYYKFIQSLGLASNTYVTIGGQAFVKGSVYGGSENGYLQADSHVTISGGQIGEGLNKTAPYADADFIDPSTTPVTTDNALATCATWTYDKVTTGVPYDKYADETGYDSKGGAVIATDGHTYYGNVFGGGRGVVPFAAGKWHRAAGSVAGNTQVDITAGHILSSVYGGNENTDVGSYVLGSDGEPTTTLEKGGTCTINMSGGTVGVPRTKEQIENNPVIGNVFGAGKGDKRVLFNTWTNVGATSVNISGTAKIYGSVFGGGEDGHVIGNAVSIIGGTVTTGVVGNTTEHSYSKVVIGSTGISGADGNVFGGGRGSETALTAGVVGGNVNLTIDNGNILGSVYGGGRLASVGTNFTNPTLENGEPDPRYGELQTPDADHGNIIVTVNDGTIGSSTSTGVNGNIFGGSKGTETNWKLGIARSTTVNMTGGTANASVYGGGELAQVVGSHTTSDQALGTEINIRGGTIGISGKGEAIWGNVYGGGKGNTTHVEAGLVKTNTKVAVSETDATNHPTLIYHNIYGGGAYGSVGEFNYDATTGMPTGRKENTTGGIATITITGGTIGTDGNENGMIFGSSRGDVGAPNSIHDKLAWVYDTQVTINGGQIKGSVYGGGENGHNYHDAVVNIQNGTIGIASGVPIGTYTSGGASYPYRGNVYGGGCGTDKYYQDPAQETHDGNGQLYNPLAGIVRGNATITMTGGTVVRNIYGAGAMGSVGTMTKDNDDHLVISSGGTTTVSISGGTVGVSGTVEDGNVFGAARGDVGTAQTDVALVKKTGVTISQAEGKTTRIYGNVYGGGALGDVGTYYTITEAGENKGNNIYLGGDESGVCTVTVTGGTIGSAGNTTVGHVFGAGKGDATTYTCQKAMVKGTTVTVSNGTIYGNVYGGGEVGRVEHDAVVTIGTGTGSGPFAPIVHGSVFGAGAGLETHGYSALVRGNSTVTVQGNAKVRKNVYGGGETATVGKYWVSKFSPDPNEAPPAGFPDGMPYKTRDGGLCTVTIQGDATVGPDEVANVSNTAGHVFGAGKGVVPHYVAPGTGQSQRMNSDGNWESFATEDAYLQFIETLALASNTNVTIGGNAAVKGSVYGGSESGFVQDHTIVTINKGEIGTAGTYAYSNIGNIFGGGRGISGNPTAGRVGRYVSLTVNDGTAHGSVYGGGEMGVVKEDVTVNILGGTIDKDVYGGGALAHTQTGNWDTSSNTWVADKIDADGKTVYKTIVNLTGGKIYGDAYGGGLGDLATRGTGHSDVAALVCGDVFVTLDGTAFDINKYEGKDIVKSGRVFGCNNLNGSPKGDVTVTVNKTVTTASGVKRTPEDPNNTGRPPMGEGVNVARSYELAAVYGGGNLADYEAEGTGRKTHVIINSCDVSINQVYGGGNAAKVPETDVLVNGAYEIHQVFGGGNGADMYTLDNGASWKVNPGADIDGNANTLMKGGYIHEAYGGSNEKGTITGNITIDTGTGGLAACPVQVDKLVGAGKNADVNGNLIIILGCKDNTKIPIVYGGADNAHVNGNVELTITSGRFGQVFGGNNLGGVIKGHIYLNIEETSDCTPIIIDDLYLGGNQAAYSRYGYYVQTTTTEGEGATGVGAPGEEPVLNADAKLILLPRTSIDDRRKPVNTYTFDEVNNKWTWTLYPETGDDAFKPYEQPVLNVTSCTSIGRVFGGGLGEGAAMYADPMVNINMIPGKHAEDQLGGEHKLGQIGIGYTDTNGQRVEGGVFGGGNEAAVYGNTTVNVGTEKTVKLHLSVVDANTGEYTMSEAKNVEGANILSNVYGGGNEADVTGNTYVNVCAKEADDASTADVIEYKGVTISGTGYEGVTIAGNVFGGGKGIADSFTCAKAMIGVDKENDGKTVITKESTNKGTRVSIGNGTVNGTVYGGGEIGRVEWNTVVTIGLPMGEGETSAPIIRGNVFGAGKGVEPFGYAALVRGNTFVTVQADAKVGHSIYGGGEIASVGKYTIASAEYAASHPEIEEGMPYSLANQGSGYCNVIVRGNAEIGPDGMVMNNTTTGKPDDLGHVFGAGKGVLPYENLATIECQEHPGQHHPGRMAPGNVWECYDGNEAKYLSFVETQALATQTDVTIDGNAFVKGSVYGGSENGHVQHDTHVTIAGGQIGAGEGINKRYTDHYGEWPTETESIETSWKECAHWEYTPNDAAPWDPYAIYESEGKYYYDAAHTQYAEGGAKVGKDGHTFYGNVFGGGSGLLPYAPGKWHRASGSVGGNTLVNITGGHILTSVYGGNEQTDVGTYKKDSKGALVVPVSGGKCTINMTGGTLGVPRTAADAKAHPVTCYLFGAGKGDQRIFFNTWTNVINTEVNISGTARIYGSTFGGGEDGHVIDNAETNISGTAIIGTTGTSYVDGNVFGGGRGFSGDAQTAGTVGGNVKVNISGGKMLGNIYGGGRLASVGTMFTAPDDPNYGNFVEDGGGKTYGHVAVNISGGTIGNTVGNAESGNVFGGSMGRLTLLDGTTINPIWPKMAQVKETNVTISGNAVIKRTVYGGGELGTVRDNATVTINGGTVNRDVYGAGYGSKDYETKTKIEVEVPKEGVTNPTSASDYDDVSYVFTPMIFAGCVGQNTYVNIAGGKVRKSVYGGGEMASVGIMDCRVKIDNNATDPVYTEGSDKYVYEHFHSHLDENNGFALSWPFHFENAPGYFGATHVNITGGRIGVADGDTDINTDNGDVYGGGKGIAGEYKNYVYCANVGSAEVTIDYPAGNTATPQNYMTNADIECIAGAVYGGAENGHVMGDTKLTLKNGLIGHSMYGGGSGKGTFSTTLLKIGSTSEHYTRDIYSFTAGKVFGNSTVEMSGGTVVRNVYGGGNMGSVGKGNYAGGADDYSTSGYGETLTGNLWDNANDYSKAFLGSGKCTVNITGGTVGYIDESDPSNSMYPWNSTASLPYGNVFGGCRGESAPNIVETPRYLYSPEFFVGYANETAVTIGKTDGSGPTILGSVYGGGQDGHVRRDASVTILGGEIGIPFTEANKTKVKTSDPNNLQWLARGNVYGSGSGIGKYKYDFDYDGKYESTVKYNNGRATVDTKEEDYSTSAGSVTRFTTVDIKGGTIHRNVYGGGSLSSIGAPKIGQSYDPYHPGDSEHSSEVGKQSLNKVTISGGHIGDADCLTSGYGGEVNGGSRGAMAFENSLANPASFANSVYTEVTISDDADVKGNVFGGGEAGIVKHDTEVKMQGGTVGNDLYGAGDMADVDGNTKVLLTGGTVTRDVFGGARGTATIAANVGGDVLVDLNGGVDPTKKGAVVKRNIFGANNVNGTPQGHVLVYVHGTQNENTDNINTKVDGQYDVLGVYGGGNQSDYVPASADTKQSTEVIIEGCDLTSIDEVYGGGYGAATPATSVLVKGTKIINNVYGGGYGASTDTYKNPGANVGYRSNKALYDQGTGKAIVQLMAGTINNVYGGSNTLGDIRGGSSVTNVANDGSAGCCEKLTVGEIYGGGKQADMFGGAEIILGCMPNDWIGAIYGGAENADIGGDVGLTLTSGKFGRVFGGNKSGGKIDGYIEVNIEENPECSTPIIIGGLYGGGNEAPYTVPQSYVDDWKAQYGPDADYPSPRVNVRAFTSIGNIYGGGFGATATVTGNPLVNINVVEGGREYAGEDKPLEDGTTVTLHARSKDAKMGVIGNVFGGGNAAKVIGNPRVEIGTAAKQKMLSLQTKDAAGTVHEVEKDVLGADIRGNVYGGGNNAAVTGDPKVVIGQRKE